MSKCFNDILHSYTFWKRFDYAEQFDQTTKRFHSQRENFYTHTHYGKRLTMLYNVIKQQRDVIHVERGLSGWLGGQMFQ